MAATGFLGDRLPVLWALFEAFNRRADLFKVKTGEVERV